MMQKHTVNVFSKLYHSVSFSLSGYNHFKLVLRFSTNSFAGVDNKVILKKQINQAMQYDWLM